MKYLNTRQIYTLAINLILIMDAYYFNQLYLYKINTVITYLPLQFKLIVNNIKNNEKFNKTFNVFLHF